MRHGTLGGIDKQQYAAYHFKHTLDFAAEVSVPGSVDNIYFNTFVMNSGVFRKYSDTALTLDSARIHDAVTCRLIFAVNSALLEHLVDKSCLTVVNVSDYSDIS